MYYTVLPLLQGNLVGLKKFTSKFSACSSIQEQISGLVLQAVTGPRQTRYIMLNLR
jgi:hypothetical protein